jgi:predicted MFS family arabinose efflux permease
LVPAYAIAFFMPTIINNLGFSTSASELLSIPPYVIGCILTVIVGIYSDKVNLRGPFVVAGALVALFGYVIAYVTSKPWPGYVAATIAASGVYPAITVLIAWAAGNSGGDMKKGVVVGLVAGIPNLVGGYVVASSS